VPPPVHRRAVARTQEPTLISEQVLALEAGGVDDVGGVDDIDARSSFTRAGAAAGRRGEQTGCEAGG